MPAVPPHTPPPAAPDSASPQDFSKSSPASPPEQPAHFGDCQHLDLLPIGPRSRQRSAWIRVENPMRQAPLPQRADRHNHPATNTLPASRHVQAPQMPLDQPLIELRNRLRHVLKQSFYKPPVSPGGCLRSSANADQRRHPSIENGQIIRPLFHAARSFDFIGIIAITLCYWSLGGLSFCVHGNTLSRTARGCQVDQAGRGGGSRLRRPMDLHFRVAARQEKPSHQNHAFGHSGPEPRRTRERAISK